MTLKCSRTYKWPEHYFSVWCIGNSHKLLTTNQFLDSTIFSTNINISFFNLCFHLFSIVTKKVNQIRSNVVFVVARLVFVFCGATTTGRCNAFSKYFRKLKEIGVLRPIFPDYAISGDYGLDDNIEKIAILDKEIFDLLEQKDAETELSNTLVRNDRIFGLIASIEEASNKNESNEVSLISNSSSTSNNNEAMCKLPELIIKEFDGSALNWQDLRDQFEPTIQFKTSISNIDKFSYLTSFLCKSAY